MKLKYKLLTLLALTTLSISAQTKKHASQGKATAALKAKTSQMSAKAKALYEDMLPNTQKVFFIDSVVTDINHIIDSIPLPNTYGRYVSYNNLFGKDKKTDTYAFVNGFNDKCYYTEVGQDSIARIYTREKLGKEWGKPQPIDVINNNFTDIGYPFMSSDGQTLFFSARSDEYGLGKRDIYMAQYDSENGVFLQPENLGLPFNSSDDDIIFIEADANRMAWFATTRRQPEGKVCIYTFIPSQQRQNYASDELTNNRLKSLASIIRIRDTWPTPEIREKEVKRMNELKKKSLQNNGSGNIEVFIVNDNVTYSSATDFKSDATRRDFNDIVSLRNDIKAKANRLEDMRTKYHNANDSERTAIGRDIAKLENELYELQNDLKKASENLRRKESALIKQ